MCKNRCFALLFALVLSGCVTARTPEGLPGNFGDVEEGKIYRGAQPDDVSIAALKRLGIHTIVKLNDAQIASETATAKRAGIQLVVVPLDPHTVGTGASCPDVERAYEAMTNRDNWPVYVHCTHGRDRTGFLVGLFRERAERWPFERVSAELKAYGHDALMRAIMPNISGSLATGSPCAR